MKRRVLILIAFLLLCGGWFSAFTATGVFGRSSLHLLLPALLLGAGLGTLLKQTNIRQTVMTLAVTAMLALGSLNYFLPQHAPRISALQSLKPTVYLLPIKVRAAERSGAFVADRFLESYEELEIQLFAVLPGVARNMVFRVDDGEGQLFVSLPELGVIYLLTDNDRDGFADLPRLYHAGLDRPTGMVWVDDRLYVAEPSRLLELRDTTADQQIDQERMVVDGLPDDGGHWRRGLIVDGEGQLYLSIGSRCNACEEADPRRGTILKIDPVAGTTTEFARGLRNTIALAWSPFDATLWGADISRQVDPNVKPPPDELNLIVAGGDFGWPYCYGQQLVDPLTGSPDRCRHTIPSRVDLPPLAAPGSMVFDSGLIAASAGEKHLFIIYSGSDSDARTPESRVVRLPYRQGEPAVEPVDFLWGWSQQKTSWGRPVAITVGQAGDLFLSDEQNRAIYRITKKKSREQ